MAVATKKATKVVKATSENLAKVTSDRVNPLKRLLESGITQQFQDEFVQCLEDSIDTKSRFDVYEIHGCGATIMLAKNVSYEKAEVIVDAVNYSEPTGAVIVPHGFDYSAYVVSEAIRMLAVAAASEAWDKPVNA